MKGETGARARSVRSARSPCCELDSFIFVDMAEFSRIHLKF